MTKISAQIIADSKNEFGNRLTTFLVTFPRYILAEFNTHRMITKNSASSRAIPFLKMLESVRNNPFIPIAWMKDHKGMQGSDYFEGVEADELRAMWLEDKDAAIERAIRLSNKGLTKQIVNRTLEPYMWHTVICTGTEWENFVALRASEFADIHIQELAYRMLEVYNESTPKYLYAGEWHIPYGDKIDEVELRRVLGIGDLNTLSFHDSSLAFAKINEAKKKIATARCARISYTVVGEEGRVDNYDNDIKLHDRLASSGHWSPFEHLGQSMNRNEITGGSFNCDDGENGTWGWSGNFRGFTQYRKFFAGENRTDARVLKK